MGMLSLSGAVVFSLSQLPELVHPDRQPLHAADLVAPDNGKIHGPPFASGLSANLIF